MRIQRPKRISLLGKQDLRLSSGSRELGILLSDQRRKLGKERAISVGKRIQEGATERQVVGRIDDGSVADELPATASKNRTFSKTPPTKLGVIKDTRAPANDRSLPQRPGEAHGGL